MGFSRLKRGQVLQIDIVGVFYLYHLFLLPSRVFVVFNV